MRAVHEQIARGRKLGKNSRFTVPALYHSTVERLHAWIFDIYLVPEVYIRMKISKVHTIYPPEPLGCIKLIRCYVARVPSRSKHPNNEDSLTKITQIVGFGP